MVAPAIIGQFGGDAQNLVGALKALGFSKVAGVQYSVNIKEKDKYIHA